MKLTKLLAFGALASAVSLMGGCGGSGGNSLPDPALRVINLAPDVNIDVDLNNSTLVSNVPFLATNTNFSSKTADPYDFFIRESGSGSDLVAEAYTLSKNVDYLYLVFGLKNFGSEPLKRLRGSLLSFSRTAPNGTKARVLAFNAYVRATGFETPAVQFRSPGDSPQISFPVTAFGGGTSLELDAGSTTLQARVSGAEEVVAEATQVLDPGKIYLMVLSGVEGGSGVTAPAIRFFQIQTE